MNRRLRIASLLILIGLVIELSSLTWSHPLSFLFFMFAGGLLLVVGILFYLYSLTLKNES
jgi:predicted membrane channel-forming protein YqfA (hemolysin III family)